MGLVAAVGADGRAECALHAGSDAGADGAGTGGQSAAQARSQDEVAPRSLAKTYTVWPEPSTRNVPSDVRRALTGSPVAGGTGPSRPTAGTVSGTTSAPSRGPPGRDCVSWTRSVAPRRGDLPTVAPRCGVASGSAQADARGPHDHGVARDVTVRDRTPASERDDRPIGAPSHRERTGLVSPHARGQTRRVRQLGRTPPAGTKRFSRCLVIRGDAGIGKSALLGYLVDQASRFRVVRAAGVQAEAELPFAGLHQLCTPLLDRLGAIPTPQREARAPLRPARGPPPGPFLLGLAVLSLLAEAAAERPLAVRRRRRPVARSGIRADLRLRPRRLVAESVALVFAVREPADEQAIAGLPQLVLGGLVRRRARTARERDPGPAGSPGARPHHRGNARQPTRAARAAARVQPRRTGRRFRHFRHPGLTGQIEESFGAGSHRCPPTGAA